MRFSTAFREPVRRKLEKLKASDVVIGIPCWNSDSTVAHVINTLCPHSLLYQSHR